VLKVQHSGRINQFKATDSLRSGREHRQKEVTGWKKGVVREGSILSLTLIH
jgi:hypothetical protein